MQNMTIKRQSAHFRASCLTRSVNVLMMTSKSMQCILEPNNCDTGMWKMLSNSLDIGNIYSDIHHQSGNKSRILFDVSWTKILASLVK